MKSGFPAENLKTAHQLVENCTKSAKKWSMYGAPMDVNVWTTTLEIPIPGIVCQWNSVRTIDQLVGRTKCTRKRVINVLNPVTRLFARELDKSPLMVASAKRITLEMITESVFLGRNAMNVQNEWRGINVAMPALIIVIENWWNALRNASLDVTVRSPTEGITTTNVLEKISVNKNMVH